MNKTELIAAVAERTDLSKEEAKKAIKAFTEVVAEQLKNGDKIQLVGFGTFEVSGVDNASARVSWAPVPGQ